MAKIIQDSTASSSGLQEWAINIQLLQTSDSRNKNRIDKSATAKVQKGTRQGCPMSPMLFYVYVKQPIQEIKKTHSI